MRQHEKPMEPIHHAQEQQLQHHPYDIKLIVPTIAGAGTFTATLGLSTHLQHRLRISTGTALLPSFLGLTAVAIASISSHLISIKAYDMIDNKHHDMLRDGHAMMMTMHGWIEQTKCRLHSYGNSFSMEALSIMTFPTFTIPDGPMLSELSSSINFTHLLRICTIGILAYKGFGGRFWSISPSSYTQPGSFARHMASLPASASYATQTKRKTIEKLGKILGCHTCGSRELFSRGMYNNGVKFIADHMPPTSAIQQINGRWYRRLFGISMKQRFYPQCTKCSQKQATILNNATREYRNSGFLLRKGLNLYTSGGGRNAYNHGFKPRLEHLAGAVVASSTVFDADSNDVQNGNQLRFEELEQKVREVFTYSLSQIRW